MYISKINPSFNSYNIKSKGDFTTKNYDNINFGLNPLKQESKFFAGIKRFFKPATDLCTKYAGKLVEGIAKKFGKLLNTDLALSVVKRTMEDKKFAENLLSHLIVLGSTLLSGFYVLRTLQNKNLEEDKKKTLAINQGAVWGVSTLLGYTLDKVINNQVNRFKAKFKYINNNYVDEKVLENYLSGIKIAQKAMIFGVIYRYISPVLVTPIANAIGNKINEKKEVKKVA